MRVLIGALSGRTYSDRRKMCRDTWMTDAATARVPAFFLVGNDQGQCDIQGDKLLLPCPDDYNSLPQKTRAFCAWALTRDDWDYLFKCDDDTYICVPRLLSHDCLGRDYIGNEWKPDVMYASGGAGYLLSRRAAGIVSEHLRFHRGAEDLLVGRLLARSDIPFHKDHRFTPWGTKDRRPTPNNDLITTHKVGWDIFSACHQELSPSVTGGSLLGASA